MRRKKHFTLSIEPVNDHAHIKAIFQCFHDLEKCEIGDFFTVALDDLPCKVIFPFQLAEGYSFEDAKSEVLHAIRRKRARRTIEFEQVTKREFDLVVFFII
jgi:hypothetical protein